MLTSCLFPALFLWTICSAFSQPNNASTESKLLLISFDGFRHDYLEKAVAFGVNISGFQRIWTSGFRALRVENEFITRTAPNHFTLATGQHEETHGLVDNAFYDPLLNKTFMFGDPIQATESFWFDNGAEPIWVTNQLHGHRSGVTFWPGSVAPIKGVLPSVYYPKYDPDRSLRSSIDDVINWLEGDINLALLYHPQPDSAGHRTGPASAEVLRIIGEMNNDLEYLLQRVNESPRLASTLNIILTSDHGMVDVDPSRTIILEEYLSDTMYTSPGSNIRVLWGLWPTPGYTANDLFVKLQKRHPKLTVYFRRDVPQRLFYSNNRRIAPVLALAETGWLIAKTREDATSLTRRGEHGYDPSIPEMSPLFLATGPGFEAFPPNHTIPSIKMVDIYPMMCHLLGLERPGPHNGSLSRIASLLRTRALGYDHWFHSTIDRFTGVLVFIILFALSTSVAVFACLSHRCRRTGSTQRFRRSRQRRGRQQQEQQQQQQGSMVRLQRLDHRTASNGAPGNPSRPLPPDEVQRLLLTTNDDDEDEVEQFNRSQKFVVDDATLIGMIRDPHLRFP